MQVSAVYVGIDFGGSDILVSEQLLHLSDTRSTLQKMGCKTVAQSVGRNILSDARIAYRTTDNIKDAHTAQPTPSLVYKECLLSHLNTPLRAGLEIEP